MTYVSLMSPTAVASESAILRARFGKHLAALDIAPAHLLVAVSGGPDSVALLDLLSAARDTAAIELTVAHVDHGIHPDSSRVAQAVRSLAAEYGLPFVTRRLALGTQASETRARTARYRALEAMRRGAKADAIVTAHHADDQAETVLMRVLRGSGPAGLAAMAPRRGRILRPLLPFGRDDLARHLQVIGRSSWADPSNTDPSHLRSWIRSAILPALRRRLPDVEARLTSLAEQAAIDRAGWDAVLALLPGIDLRVEPDGISVGSNLLEIADRNLLICSMMAVARRCGISLGPARAARAAQQLESGLSGTHVPLTAGWILELSYGRVRFVRPGEKAATTSTSLGGGRGILTWGGWHVSWASAKAPDRQDRVGMTAWFEPGDLTVRTWRPGERVRPLRGRGSRLLVRCFQDARVPRSQRAGWPVLESAGSLVWVPAVCRSDLLLPLPGAEALRVDAELA